MRISVIAHPNAKKPRIETDLLGTLHVYVSQPPLEGKANKAVTEALANYYKVKKNNITLLSGQKTRTRSLKLFEFGASESYKAAKGKNAKKKRKSQKEQTVRLIKTLCLIDKNV